MGTRRIGLVGLSLAASIGLVSLAALAQSKGPKPPIAKPPALPKGPVPRAPIVKGPRQPAPPREPAPPPAQPDISIYDLSVDADCHIIVHLMNVGGAPIPATTTSIGLRMTEGNTSAWTLQGNSLPREPGAKTTFEVPTYRVNGSITQTATLTGVGPELSSNNSRTETLTCSSSLPDLALTVTTKPDCTKLIKLTNAGDAAPTPNTWSSLSVKRSVDGMTYEAIPVSTIDPGRALQNPGGTASYSEPASSRAYDRFAYNLDYPYQEKNDNKANNAVSANVPTHCKSPRPPIDLALTEVKLNASCQVVATAKNVGTTALPPIPMIAKFYKNGASAGQWTFDAGNASAPGSAAPVHGPYYRETTPMAFKVVIETPSLLAETNKTNNTTTATLTCPR